MDWNWRGRLSGAAETGCCEGGDDQRAGCSLQITFTWTSRDLRSSWYSLKVYWGVGHEWDTCSDSQSATFIFFFFFLSLNFSCPAWSRDTLCSLAMTRNWWDCNRGPQVVWVAKCSLNAQLVGIEKTLWMPVRLQLFGQQSSLPMVVWPSDNGAAKWSLNAGGVSSYLHWGLFSECSGVISCLGCKVFSECYWGHQIIAMQNVLWM